MKVKRINIIFIVWDSKVAQTFLLAATGPTQGITGLIPPSNFLLAQDQKLSISSDIY